MWLLCLFKKNLLYFCSLDFSDLSRSKLKKKNKKKKSRKWQFLAASRHQKVQESVLLSSDKYGFTLVRLHYKQTLCTLLCNYFAWWLNGRLDRSMRPWETPNMKAVVCSPRKFCWHLITKREKWKKISRSPQRSLRVILRERNLCDIDRIVHKRGRFACARTNTHTNLTNFLSLAFFGVVHCRGSEAAEVMDVRLPSVAVSTRLALMDLLETWVKLMGKLTPKIKPRLFAFSALFSGSQPHSALSTPNILHRVKPPIKICFSLPHLAGHSLPSWESESALESNQWSQSLLLFHTYFSMSCFQLIWQSFLMSRQTGDSL